MVEPRPRARWRWAIVGCATLIVAAGVAGWQVLAKDEPLPEFCQGVGYALEGPTSAWPTPEAALRAHLQPGEDQDAWREDDRGTWAELYSEELRPTGDEVVFFVNTDNVHRPESEWRVDVVRRNDSWYVSAGCEGMPDW
jgi:hypothetical protein